LGRAQFDALVILTEKISFLGAWSYGLYYWDQKVPMADWTEDHLRSAVPDVATLKRGQQLAVPSNWKEIGSSERAFWGLCQGSGSKPYQVVMDITGPAFKCSCPSRTFPCKHGAGLMVMVVTDRSSFGMAHEPEWVEAWLNKRGEKQATGPTETVAAKAPADPEAQAKREAKRFSRMAEGLADLDRWLIDIARTGIASLQSRPRPFQEDQAARLVDAQLPGLAARLRSMNTFEHKNLLNDLGELYLLVATARRSEQLPSHAQEEIAQLLGINVKKERLIADVAGVNDHWLVLGHIITVEDRLTQRRTWFHGRNSKRYALMIDHAFGSQGFENAFIHGAVYEGEMFFFPGLYPIRATAQELQFRPEITTWDIPATGFVKALDDHASALASDPWLRQFPFWLADVVPEYQKDRWYLRHKEGLLPMVCSMEEGWTYAAYSGGSPIEIFGEWSGRGFLPVRARLILQAYDR
jgi:hypothetical protein